MNTLERAGLAFIIGGVGGWLIENGACKEARQSHVVPEGVPFLPVWGAGATAVALMSPHLRGIPTIARGVIYAGSLGALEWGVGTAEKHLIAKSSWDYGGAKTDVPHILVWGMLGLLAEAAIDKLP